MQNEETGIDERHLRALLSKPADQMAIQQAIEWARRCDKLDLSPEMRGAVNGLVQQLTLLVLTRRYD